MSEPVNSAFVTESRLPLIGAGESPFLCTFCEDIKIAVSRSFDMQRELDVCRRCVGVDRSTRFGDYLVIQ